MLILPLAPEPFTCPTDRDMLPSERREFVRTHRTCVFGYARRTTAPPCRSCTTSPPTTTSSWCRRWRPRQGPAVARNPKVSLCVLDERWPFAFLQVYADATVDGDPDLVVDVMMAVGGRMSGEALGADARPSSPPWPRRKDASSCAAAPTRPSPSRLDTSTATTSQKRHPLGLRAVPVGRPGPSRGRLTDPRKYPSPARVRQERGPPRSAESASDLLFRWWRG